MTDLALIWNAEAFAGDLLLDGGSLATDDGLRSAILISLFSDARAPDGAELPEDGADRRGWWGDAFAADTFAGGAQPVNALGSTLWLLARAKITAAVLQQARSAVQAALAWLLRDGIARAIEVAVEAQLSPGGSQRLAIAVMLDRPQGPARERYDFVWEASA